MSILVVGALHLDVVVTAPKLPSPDETVTGSDVAYVFGGKGGNQALAAARMGAAVHFAGRAGSDGFGDQLRASLRASTVDITQVQRDAGPSGMSAAIIDSVGDYGAVIVSAANLNIDANAVVIPTGCKIVILQNEVPETVNLAVAQKAKQAGAAIWLNAAPARDLPRELVALLDLVIVNRVEASQYVNVLNDVDTLTTLGEEGVRYAGVSYSGYPVDVISTHGAGDVFVGALAAQMAEGEGIHGAIDFAQAAAALHVSTAVTKRDQIGPQAIAQFRSRQDNR